MYDIAFVGNYTKDTIVSAAGTRVVDGGAFNYGAHAAVQMGLRTAAVTRLAGEDWHVVEGLARLGVDVLCRADAPVDLPATGVSNRQRRRAGHLCDKHGRDPYAAAGGRRAGARLCGRRFVSG